MGNDLTGWSPSPGGRETHGALTTTGGDAPTHFSGDPKIVAQAQAAYKRAVDRTVPWTVISEWKDDPAGVDFRMRTALAAIEDIRHIDAGTRRQIGARYDYLAEPIRAAIWRELGNGKEGHCRMQPDRHLERFWEQPEGRYLRQVWGLGLNADKKVSQVIARLERIRDELDDHEVREFNQFIDALSPYSLACCLAVLA